MPYHSARRRRGDEPVDPVDVVCVVVVLAAIVALVVWVITQAGGGALMI